MKFVQIICSDKNFISPTVITVKRDKTVKLALDSKILNKSIHKNKYQTPNIDNLIIYNNDMPNIDNLQPHHKRQQIFVPWI